MHILPLSAQLLLLYLRLQVILVGLGLLALRLFLIVLELVICQHFPLVLRGPLLLLDTGLMIIFFLALVGVLQVYLLDHMIGHNTLLLLGAQLIVNLLISSFAS